MKRHTCHKTELSHSYHLAGAPMAPGSARSRRLAARRAIAAVFGTQLLVCAILVLVTPSAFGGEKLSWKAVDKGTQGFWHQWPNRIYNGPIGFTAKEVESTPDGLQLKKKMDTLGVECHFTCADVKDKDYPSMIAFFVKKLKEPSQAASK